MTESVWLLQAEIDSQHIYNDLEDFQEGRGELFLLALESAEGQLKVFPQSAPLLKEPFRRLILQGYPFAIIYSLHGTRLVIHCIACLKQDLDKLLVKLENL